MRFTFASFVAVAVTFGVTAAPVPKVKPIDEDTIVGVWQVVAIDLAPGVPIPPIDHKQTRFEFKAGGKFKISGKKVIPKGEMPAYEGEYKLDPTAKAKAIDMTHKGRVLPGIYELDGDSLKICVDEGDNSVRPTEMKPDCPHAAVATLKRIKDEKKDK